mgnify:CR=1 FL=1
MKRSTTDVKMGGGVWRIKQSPTSSSSLLTACMHNGFHIVDIDDVNLRISHGYSEHESLAYGADWKLMNDESSTFVAATCSFYDHLLKIWNVSLAKKENV